MDSEKILFCYRDDKIATPCFKETGKENREVVAIPCVKTFWGRKFRISTAKLKKQIASIYEKCGASYLWLDDELCEYLKMEKQDLPDVLIDDWLEKLPFYHTLVFSDDSAMRAYGYLSKKTERLAILGVVCYEVNREAYEALAAELFLKEGIVMQIFTYEELEKNTQIFRNQAVLKGRAAVLDFEERRSFWDRRLGNEIVYHSFLMENRLFLDTFRKNRYNTLTK